MYSQPSPNGSFIAPDAEYAALGSMVLQPDMVDQSRPIVSSEDFAVRGNGTIFEAMCNLRDSGEDFDLVTLHQWLVDKGVIEQVGGIERLVEIAQSVPSPEGCVRYSRIVAEKSRLRKIADLGRRLSDRAASSEASSNIAADIQEELLAICAPESGKRCRSIADFMSKARDRLYTDGVRGFPTGISTLDAKYLGLVKGEVTVVGARPSVGKSAFSMGVALHCAEKDMPGAVFSLEMSGAGLATRVIAGDAGVNLAAFDGPVPAHLRDNINAVIESYERMPLVIDESPDLSLSGLRSRCRTLKAIRGIEYVVIDYIQLMRGPQSESREQEVAKLSRGIKIMAQELDIAVIALSQLNRDMAKRGANARPTLADLRNSGAIEQDADNVILLHREMDDRRQLTEEAEAIVAKQRNGPTGIAPMRYIAEKCRFFAQA